MLNDLSSPAAFLATRRSGKPRDMAAPGPDAGQLEAILRTAARVPDHGKLAPWRFVILEDRDAFAALLARAFSVTKPDAQPHEVEANEQFARQAPALVAVLSTPVRTSNIPLWEQELSAGAACQNLVSAATAQGFVAGWLSGWAAYSDTVRDALSDEPDARIAGFIFIGSPARGIEERPRPDIARVVSRWPQPLRPEA